MLTTSLRPLAAALAAVLALGLTTPVQAQISPLINPYTAGAPGLAGGGLVNPYMASGMGGLGGFGYGGLGYNPFFSPFRGLGLGYAYGSYLSGASDVIDSQGRFLLNEEYARIYRERANQAKFETIKKRFDLAMYLRENRPTFTDDQIKVAAERLKRIQQIATPNEIWNGTALNVLLKDLDKNRSKNVEVSPIPMKEDILRRLNVTSGGRAANLGVLRNEGRITWPSALVELLPEAARKDMNVQAQELVQQAASGQTNSNVLKDLRKGVDATYAQLLANVNEVPTSQYLEAKRFLEAFQSAIRALENPQVALQQINFQKWANGGHSVEEVLRYLQENGLHFAPATEGDEAAYQAMYSALANYDINLNAQLASNGPGPNPSPAPKNNLDR